MMNPVSMGALVTGIQLLIGIPLITSLFSGIIAGIIFASLPSTTRTYLYREHPRRWTNIFFSPPSPPYFPFAGARNMPRNQDTLVAREIVLNSRQPTHLINHNSPSVQPPQNRANGDVSNRPRNQDTLVARQIVLHSPQNRSNGDGSTLIGSVFRPNGARPAGDQKVNTTVRLHKK